MKWISIEKEKPPINKPILVYFPTEDRGSCFETTCFMVEGKVHWDCPKADTYPNSCNYQDFYPQYWMLLPDVPNEMD